MKSKFLIYFFLLNSVFDSVACEMSKDQRINYFSSYESHGQGYFLDRARDSIRPAHISKCQSSSGQFLMLSLGLKSSQLNSDVRDKSYDGSLVADRCSLKNSPFLRNRSSDDRKSYFDKQFHHLRSCYFLQVSELNGRDLVFPEIQKFCKVTHLTRSTAKLEGDACFLQIQPYYQLAVGVGQNPACAVKEELVSMNLHPKDLDLSLDAFVAGDASGLSTQLEPIGAQPIRAILTPDSTLLELSPDQGTQVPRFPSTYSVELHQGPLVIRSLGEDRTHWDIQLAASNFLEAKCNGAFCASPSDFSQSAIGMVTLKELEKLKILDEWIVGSYAPADWQGILKGMHHVSEGVHLKIGKKYQIDVEVVDPTIDYSMWLSALPQLLIDLRDANGVAGIDIFSPLSSLQSLISIPEVAALPTLTGGELTLELDKAIERLKDLRMGFDWPPFYEKFCEQRSGKCRKTDSDKYLLRLSTQFKVTSLNEENIFEISEIKVKRQSPYFLNYERSIQSFPQVECEN